MAKDKQQKDLAPFYRIVKGPVLTEKIMTPAGPRERDDKGKVSGDPRPQYGFWVDRNANKIEIRHAIEAIFDVKVEAVRTQVLKGKYHRSRASFIQEPPKKKAVVTLKEGHVIDFF